MITHWQYRRGLNQDASQHALTMQCTFSMLKHPTRSYCSFVVYGGGQQMLRMERVVHFITVLKDMPKHATVPRLMYKTSKQASGPQNYNSLWG